MSQSELESPEEPYTDDTLIPIEDLNYKVFEKQPEDLNVVDVYNIASSVGQEFERLTDAFGGAIFGGVMPKIIRILEILELLVVKRQEEVHEIVEMKSQLQKLLADCKLKDVKQKEELEIVESSWKDETRELIQNVQTLQEDNQKLALLFNEKFQEENDNEVNYTLSEQQTSTIGKLQQQMLSQRDEIRSKNRTIEEQNYEADALQSQIQRLTKLNVGVRHKVSLLEQQGKSLIEQKADLESRLNEKEKSKLDLQLKTLPSSQPSTPCQEVPPGKSIEQASEDNWPGDPLLANKLVIDLNDPNRPRYTLQELQEVLNDRNHLKAKLFLQEEELLFYRGLARKLGYDESWEELNFNEIRESKKAIEGKTKPAESGIRKFFSYLTGDATWRRSSQPHPPNAKEAVKPRHQVVDSADEEDLLSTGDVEKLLPGVTVTQYDETEDRSQSSEMRVMTSESVRDDLVP